MGFEVFGQRSGISKIIIVTIVTVITFPVQSELEQLRLGIKGKLVVSAVIIAVVYA